MSTGAQSGYYCIWKRADGTPLKITPEKVASEPSKRPLRWAAGNYTICVLDVVSICSSAEQGLLLNRESLCKPGASCFFAIGVNEQCPRAGDNIYSDGHDKYYVSLVSSVDLIVATNLEDMYLCRSSIGRAVFQHSILQTVTAGDTSELVCRQSFVEAINAVLEKSRLL